MNARDTRRLAGALRRRARDLAVLATFVPPVRVLLVRAYDAVAVHLARTLVALPDVREVGLTGSLATGDGVPGASDVDLVVVAAGGPDQRTKRTVRRIFARTRRFFPLIGETDERTDNLLFGTDLATNPFAAVHGARLKAGSYRVLASRDGPRARDARTAADGGSAAASPRVEFAPAEVVAEITLQLQAIATQTLAGGLNLYFWKSKLRVLENLLHRSGDGGTSRVPALDDAQAALLRELRATPNRRLYFRRDPALDALAWRTVQALVAALVARHDLDGLDATSVAFRATPARQVHAAAGELPPGLRPHAFAARPADFGGDSVLDAPALPFLLLEADDARWETLRAALEATRAPAEQALVLLWLGGFVLQLHRGRCRGVFSRWDRPWLFPDRLHAPGRLAFPRPFLERLLAERDLDLGYLRDAFYWRVLDPAASSDPERHGDALRYFEDRQRTLDGFAFIHVAQAQSAETITSFGARDDVFADAAGRAGAAAPMLAQLRRYARAVADGTLARDAAALPPALLRSARRHFAELLYGRTPGAADDAGARLTLSICVCTRNRAAMLAALLESVVAQTRRPDEVLIVDNASTDDTAEVARRFAGRLPVRHVVDHGDTIARVRNRALREASGEIVCFTDDDCVLHPTWLHFVEESFFLDEQIGIVGGRVFHLEEGPSLVDDFHRAYLGVRL